ncbi:hypothetical protein [Mesorhizobium sp. M7A.F.Ca.US.010.02.1.1]|uniref:hypothetical protein n=1 Tax=Mesorhizobium sp. M7A.F.Ca.US.010.02.1.1 TaxID=2496743 RepID=UPI0032AEE942
MSLAIRKVLYGHNQGYGRAPTFLLLIGYEQVRSVAAVTADDMAAAMHHCAGTG